MKSNLILVGIDEVGRGCLAGPVWACAYAFKRQAAFIDGLKDSKKLSSKKRESLIPALEENGWFGHGSVSAAEIDEIGIVAATFEAMRLALLKMQSSSGINLSQLDVVIDGNILPRWDDVQLGSIRWMIRADDLVPEVSAASVLAKVARDQLMAGSDSFDGKYGFVHNSGYGTPLHMAALMEHGPNDQHRMSFAPLNTRKSTPKR